MKYRREGKRSPSWREEFMFGKQAQQSYFDTRTPAYVWAFRVIRDITIPAILIGTALSMLLGG